MQPGADFPQLSKVEGAGMQERKIRTKGTLTCADKNDNKDRKKDFRWQS